MSIVRLSIRSVPLPKDKSLISVDYQISNDGTFSGDDIIIDINKDNVNLSGREFEIDFTVQDTYYGRIKLNFNSDGSDYYIGRPVTITRSGDGFSYNNAIIVTPKIEINTDIDNAELGGFNISSSKFILFSGVGNHKYTNWIIKNTNNEIVWSRNKDTFNLTNIRIPNDLLKINKHYILEVTYVSNGNEKSNTGRSIIKTMGTSKLAEMVGYGDLRVTSVEYNELRDNYEDLLEIIVNAKALGILI